MARGRHCARRSNGATGQQHWSGAGQRIDRYRRNYTWYFFAMALFCNSKSRARKNNHQNMALSHYRARRSNGGAFLEVVRRSRPARVRLAPPRRNRGSRRPNLMDSANSKGRDHLEGVADLVVRVRWSRYRS